MPALHSSWWESWISEALGETSAHLSHPTGRPRPTMNTSNLPLSWSRTIPETLARPGRGKGSPASSSTGSHSMPPGSPTRLTA